MPADWGGKADQTVVIGTEPGLKFDKKEITGEGRQQGQVDVQQRRRHAAQLRDRAAGQAVPVGELAMKLGIKGQELNYIRARPRCSTTPS
jgi:hypothetical protein